MKNFNRIFAKKAPSFNRNRLLIYTMVFFQSFALFASTGYAQVADSVNYKGFTIRFQQKLKEEQSFSQIIKAVENQIDIVHLVGLSAQVLVDLQKVPMVITPETIGKGGTPGAYNGQMNRIVINTKIINLGNKPILLHELMHAYQHNVLPNGKNNKHLAEAYANAAANNMYNKKSHMMANVGEFFACFATTYLYGVTGQEPFLREKIKTSQPELCDFFHDLFGSKSGSYIGSLEKK